MLGSIPDRSKYLAIIGALCLHGSKAGHLKYLSGFSKGMLKNGLKISPNKFQLFNTELQHMVNTILIKDK